MGFFVFIWSRLVLVFVGTFQGTLQLSIRFPGFKIFVTNDELYGADFLDL